jgi:hypothetical protein
MTTVEMTRCTGGEHVTLQLSDGRNLPVLYSDLTSPESLSPEEFDPVAVAVKQAIVGAGATEWDAMKVAVEGLEFP